MATDVAEFLGAAIGLNLLFGVPLLIAGLITGVIAFAILELQRAAFAASSWRSPRCWGSCFARLPVRDAADRPLGATTRCAA